MAMLNVRENLETLVVKTKLHGCMRQLILGGSFPLLTNPYVSYGDRVLVDFRIALTPGEKEMSLAELCEKFSEFNFLKFPNGNTEFLKSQFNGKYFMVIYYHNYSTDAGISLYNRLKEEYFLEK